MEQSSVAIQLCSITKIFKQNVNDLTSSQFSDVLIYNAVNSIKLDMVQSNFSVLHSHRPRDRKIGRIVSVVVD